MLLLAKPLASGEHLFRYRLLRTYCAQFAQNSRINALLIEEASMKSFLFGLGLGVSLGILFAPMSGEDTRNNLSERANDLANSARESVEQGRERVRRGVGALRNISGREGCATGTEGASM
jgi:hypothetical protein